MLHVRGCRGGLLAYCSCALLCLLGISFLGKGGSHALQTGGRLGVQFSRGDMYSAALHGTYSTVPTNMFSIL
jgi:hypothetical protein